MFSGNRVDSAPDGNWGDEADFGGNFVHTPLSIFAPPLPAALSSITQACTVSTAPIVPLAGGKLYFLLGFCGRGRRRCGHDIFQKRRTNSRHFVLLDRAQPG
jgi:hypothetical protein